MHLLAGRTPAARAPAVGSVQSGAIAQPRVLARPARAGRPRTAAPRRGAALRVRAATDYYETLGVSRDATQKQIKTAYRQKARKFHPDVNKEPGAEDKFKEISNAYEVLSDDQKRQIYDRFGEAGLKGGGFGGAGGAYGGDGGFSDPFDIFNSFFGGMGGMGGFGGSAGMRNRPVPGEDERADLSLDFLEAVFGCQKEVSISHLITCDTCTGSGVKAGTSPTTCGTCGGSGQVVSAARTPLGVFQQVTSCPDCGGTGQRSTPCSSCAGQGRVRENKTINLRVPAGVDSGSRLRVRGEGNAGRRGGENGNLFVFISVRDDPDLRRDGQDIRSAIEVPYAAAILGTTVSVRTVDGSVDLRVPAGTQPGTTLLMKGRGVPGLGTSVRGDHMVKVKVTIPTKLSSEEKRLVEKLQELQEAKAQEKKGFPFFGGKKD
ncbi:unnamed protein product [Pedinophyceae sp. YPF-701]|nr:unnamed protein product [Pedinophyceae sp. YPF-701]